MSKYIVTIWFEDKIDVGNMKVEAKSKEEACILAMMKGNYGKEYYPQAELL